MSKLYVLTVHREGYPDGKVEVRINDVTAEIYIDGVCAVSMRNEGVGHCKFQNMALGAGKALRFKCEIKHRQRMRRRSEKEAAE